MLINLSGFINRDATVSVVLAATQARRNPQMSGKRINKRGDSQGLRGRRPPGPGRRLCLPETGGAATLAELTWSLGASEGGRRRPWGSWGAPKTHRTFGKREPVRGHRKPGEARADCMAEEDACARQGLGRLGAGGGKPLKTPAKA